MKTSTATEREKIRISSSRAERCQTNLRRIGRNSDALLSINSEKGTAHIDMSEVPWEAVISGREFDQPATEYSPLAWDWLVQRVLTAHEAAHARYTPHDYKMECLEQYDRSERQIAQDLWNAMEDCAIEKLLKAYYSAYKDLISAFRANMMKSNVPEDGCTIGMKDAIEITVLEKGTHSVGRTEMILDREDDTFSFESDEDRETFVTEVLPLLHEYLKKVLSESDPIDRTDLIFEFVDQVLPYIDNADKSEGGDQSSSQSGPMGMPDDSDTEGDSSQAESGDELDGEMNPQTGSETDEEMEEKLENEANSDSGKEGDSSEGEADGASGEVDGLEECDFSSSGEPATLSAAEEEADKLSRILNQYTRSDSRRTVRNKRKGVLDPASVHRHRSGEKRLMMRRDKPDKPDRAYVVILDRSGSMGGQTITKAEIATYAFTRALEDQGASVAVLSLHENKVKEDSPFAETAQDSAGKLLSGETSGGTPLKQALTVGRETLDMARATQKEIIVITDDGAASPDKYKDAVVSSSYPVTGIVLSQRGDESPYNNSTVTDPSGSSLSQDLQTLAKRMVSKG